MPRIKTKITYLEMFSPPKVEVPAPRPDVDIRRIARPSVDFYRHLYREIGSAYHWVDRLVMTERQLEAILQDDRVEVFVLTLAEQPAGLAELDRRQADEIELGYFGLFPEAIGQGLGKYLLNWALRTAWAYGPRRVWVHTCDLDHPAALPNYLKAGFEIYDEAAVDQWIPSAPS